MVRAGACWRSYHARAGPAVRSVFIVTLFVGLFIMATVIIGVTSDDGLITVVLIEARLNDVHI